MTSKDDTIVDDKEFDAFLQRDGDLAQLLDKLPQGAPSAELDAAILAAAKAELEKAPASPMRAAGAANDAQAAGIKSTSPGFIRRWRVPLGLAASLLVTVQLVRLEMADEQTVPNAPAVLFERSASPAPAPAAIQQEKMVEEARGPELKSVQEERRKKVQSNAPPVERELAKEEDKVVDAAKTVPAVVLRKPAVASYAVAPATIAPPPAPTEVARARVTEDLPARAEEPLTANEAPFSAPAPVAAPVTRSSLQSSDAAGSASRRVAEDQRQVAAPAPAPQVAARPTAAVAASPVVAAEVSAVNPADAWLKKIDALLKAGSNQEALLEWRKFRKAYPDYVAPDALNQKMKALDK